jgi:WD40 repeat protein
VRQGSGKNGVPVQGVAYSPTGSVVLTTDENGHVTVWNPHSASIVDTFTGHEDRVLGIAFAADGRTAYTCSLDGAIFAWDLSRGHRFGRPFALRIPSDAAYNAPPTPPLAVSSDSKEFATRLTALQVGLFSVSSLKREAAFSLPVQAVNGNAITGIAWSPRQALIAVGVSDGTVELWDVAHKPRLVRTLRGSASRRHPLLSNQVAFSPDGTRVLDAGFIFTPPQTSKGMTAVWRVSDGRLLWRKVYGGSTDGAAFSDDGRLLALGQEPSSGAPLGGDTQIVNATTGAVERTVHPVGAVGGLGFAPDGTLEVGTFQGILQRFDVKTEREIGQEVLAMPAPVASLEFQPRSDVFAVGGGSGGNVKLWDAKTQTQIGTALPGSPGQYANAVYTPDGSRLVTIYADGRGSVWPVTLAAWKAHACSVAGRNFTPAEWHRFVGGRYSTVCPKP